MIESSGRRESPESITEAKYRGLRKQAKLSANSAPVDEEDLEDSDDSSLKKSETDAATNPDLETDDLEDTTLDDQRKYHLGRESFA